MSKKIHDISEKDKIVIVNILGAFGIKGLALVISLFSTPAYLRFFHNESALGLWFTINSVLAWILNFDLGIGNGLRNHLARTYTEHNDTESRKYISSAYISVAFVCLLIFVCFGAAFDAVNWNVIFNIESENVSDEALRKAIKIVFLGIILQLLLKLINSILYAIQKSSVNNFLALCTSAIILVCLYVLPSKDNDDNIVMMAVVHHLAVTVPLFIMTIVVFTRTELKQATPRFCDFSMKCAKEILFLGGTFLLIQLAYMVIMTTNEYLITLFCSSQWVVTYQLYHKPFSLVGTVFTLALTPVWSAVTKASAEKDLKWIETLYKKLIRLCVLGSVISFAAVPFMQIFMDFWLGRNYLEIEIRYAVAFAVLNITIMLNGVLSSFANGIGKLRVQLVCFAMGAVIKVPVAFLLVKTMGSWIGVVWANILSLVIFCIAQPVALQKELHSQ